MTRTNEQEEWGPVIVHNGLTRPVADGTYVRAWLRSGSVVEAITGRSGVLPDGSLVRSCAGDAWIWGSFPGMEACDVIRYQIKLPHALLRLRELIEESHPLLRQLEDVG